MLLKLIRYFKGYISIRLTGNFTERFINICMARRIIVWNIKKENENTMTLCLATSDFMRIRPVAKKSRVKVRIIEKCGLRAKLKKYKHRKLFVIGLFIFISFVFVMSRFVWHIEIDGLTYTSEQQLLATLKEAGIYPGSLKSKIDQIKVKDTVLLKEDSLSWIWVDIKGTKALVSVTQRKKPPEVIDNNKPCDIIASKDGIISSYTATSGTALIKEGDSVFEGQTLISSVMNSNIISPRYTRASGEVWARTWYTETGTFYTDIYPLTQTGNKKNYRALCVFGKDINLFLKKNPPYDTYSESNRETEIKLFGINTGIKIKTATITEISPQKRTLSEDELLKYAEEQLFRQIEPLLCEKHEQIAKNLTYSVNSSGSYTIELTAEYNEQIGKSVPIENPIEFDLQTGEKNVR